VEQRARAARVSPASEPRRKEDDGYALEQLDAELPACDRGVAQEGTAGGGGVGGGETTKTGMKRVKKYDIKKNV